MTTDDRAVFEAAFPSTQGAIRIHGDSGMRIELDIDESNVPAALSVMLWRDRLLKVTIEPATDSDRDGTDSHRKPQRLHI